MVAVDGAQAYLERSYGGIIQLRVQVPSASIELEWSSFSRYDWQSSGRSVVLLDQDKRVGEM
jgi:hypothetical protein